MIRKLKKYLFIGLKQDQDAFFKKMQKKGFIEFLSTETKKVMQSDNTAQKLIDAIKILRKMPVKEQLTKNRGVHAAKLAQSILSSQETIDKLEEEIKFIQSEICRIQPLGDFSLSKIREIEKDSNRLIQFFCIKKDKLHQVESIGDYIYIASFFDLDFFISISKEKKMPEHMIEMRLEEDLATLKQREGEKKALLKEKRLFLHQSAGLIEFLQDAAIDAINQTSLIDSKTQAEDRLEDFLFSIEGWMPIYQSESIIRQLENQGIIVEEIAIDPTDKVPTCMTNKGVAHIGEDLVHIYDTPSPRDKDPSLFVFWAFIVFYAVIISDAGYGFLYVILAFFMGWKLKDTKVASLKRFVKLFKVIALSTIVWGVLAGSYFGMDLKPGSVASKVSLLDTLARKKAQYHIGKKDETYTEWIKKIPGLKEANTDYEFLNRGVEVKEGKTRYVVLTEFKDSIFLEIALIMGILHITIALFYSIRQHLANIGWFLAIVGSYLYFPDMLGASSIVYFLHIITPSAALVIGRDLMLTGFSLALILALIQHRMKGLMSIAKVIELFADILSYLRLYALGLAGMILASTFNDMGTGLMETAGIIVGVIVIILGHMINIVVGIMGGTIHGLRLNFIEWYHHCFEGGGRLFRPLRLLTKRR